MPIEHPIDWRPINSSSVVQPQVLDDLAAVIELYVCGAVVQERKEKAAAKINHLFFVTCSRAESTLKTQGLSWAWQDECTQAKNAQGLADTAAEG